VGRHVVCTRPSRVSWIVIVLAHRNNSSWVDMSFVLDQHELVGLL
jgi:hypothetical protein